MEYTIQEVMQPLVPHSCPISSGLLDAFSIAALLPHTPAHGPGLPSENTAPAGPEKMGWEKMPSSASQRLFQ